MKNTGFLQISTEMHLYKNFQNGPHMYAHVVGNVVLNMQDCILPKMRLGFLTFFVQIHVHVMQSKIPQRPKQTAGTYPQNSPNSMAHSHSFNTYF